MWMLLKCINNNNINNMGMKVGGAALSSIPKLQRLVDYGGLSNNKHSIIPTCLTLPNHISLPRNKPTSTSTSTSTFCSKTSSSSSPLLTQSKPSGEIHVIVGPMFAGKTTTLLTRIRSHMDNGRSVVVIKSDKDGRYGLDSIVTHDGIRFPCRALPSLSSFRQDFGHDAYNQLDVIGIDEAQFFEDLYDFCREAADQDGKTVIVAGLDGDYLRRSFGLVLDVIPLADSVTKLTARCELCGKRALFTLRKTEETQTELIGGADIYMPVCRQHYISGQAAVETARSVGSQKVECDIFL